MAKTFRLNPTKMYELRTIAQSARVLGCDRKSIRRYIKRNALPTANIAGIRFIRESDLRQLQAAKQVKEAI